MRPPARAALIAALAALAASRTLGAQAVRGEAGGAVTAALRVANRSRASLPVTPHVTPPAEWAVLLGAAPFTLAPGESDTWLVSVRIPARAAAGRYAIRLMAASAGRELLRDSLVVDVASRHAVELSLAERPPYAVSGTPYRTAFLLRNRGNVPATVALRATSAMGSLVDLPPTLSLAPDESRTVRVQVATVMAGQEARDDVIELRAVDAGDTTVSAAASLRMTVVQRAGTTEPMHTVASTLRLRAADAAAGVSPFELTGGGSLRETGADRVEFVARGRSGPSSPFGDREEYRIGLRGTNYQAQAGDALYLASPLASSGQRGFGAGLSLGDTVLGGGAYTQRFRLPGQQGTEQGAFVRFGGDAEAGAPRLGLHAVDRTEGPFAGRILGASARVHPIGDLVVDFEYAGSRGPSGPGVARSGRIGGGKAVHVEVGHLSADTGFAGPGRGAASSFASLTTQPWNELRLLASAAATSQGLPLGGFRFLQRQQTANVELAYQGQASLAYTSLSRSAVSAIVRNVQEQRGLVARGEQTLGLTHLWGTAEGGAADDGSGRGSHAYQQLALGGTTPFGAHALSLFGESSRGAAVMRGADRLLAFGFDARLQVASTTTFALGATETRVVPAEASYSQVDARLTHLLPTGASITMRVRLGGHDLRDAAMGQKLAYLEYATPLQVPVGPSRATGRVHGRVVDQGTGRGVAGALVRLGPQAAITDDEGRVAFAGLPSGAYRLTLAPQASSATTVFAGDPNVTIDGSRHDAVTFHVAVEAGGVVSGTVRSTRVARTGIGEAPDSLVDGGPLEGVSVALIGVRDTLYRVTNGKGRFEFTDVPSGAWTAVVMGETPDQTGWEAERIPVTLRAGGRETVAFRIVPRRRRVRIISGDGVIEGGDQR